VISVLEINQIHQGNCLELMQDIPDKSVDLILCDLPYGTTACKWDTIIPFDKLWKQYERIIKDTGVIVLNGTQPFTSKLIMSKIDLFKYVFYWKKNNAPNYPHAKNMPLKIIEEIIIFSKGKIGHISQLKDKRMTYNPQGTEKCHYKRKGNRGTANEDLYIRPSHKGIQTITQKGFPKNLLEFHYDYKEQIHPTQKPIKLFEYLIKTFSKEGDLVLDNCIGSGTTAIACKRNNRNFIGIEKKKTYVDIAKRRLCQNILSEVSGNSSHN